MSDTHENTDVALSASGSDGSVEVEESSVGCECHTCMKASQRCPPGCHDCMREKQKCQPNCEECMEDEARERERREEEEEWERKRRIEQPWLYETQKPVTEPPDINYRSIIIQDQESIDRLLENEDMHFTERCLSYQEQDVWMECDILMEYSVWSTFMLSDAKESGDNTRKEFFQGLSEVVKEDREMVSNEWVKLYLEREERGRQRAAQRLRVPANHEEWTREDRQRFYEDDEYVQGWPMNDRTRYRAAQRLGIPENHEERTTKDKRRYADSDERVLGWPRRWEVGEFLEEMDEANSATPSQNTESEQIENGNQPPPSEAEDSERSLTLSDMDNERSSPSNAPTSTLPEQETESSSAADSKGEPLDNDSLSSLPLNIELRPQWRTSHYRTIASLLLTLLVYEMVKLKLRV